MELNNIMVSLIDIHKILIRILTYPYDVNKVLIFFISFRTIMLLEMHMQKILNVKNCHYD